MGKAINAIKKNNTVEIIDAQSFRLRTATIIVLEGVDKPNITTSEDQKVKEKLSELVLKKKVEYETTPGAP
jgi:hypothetical protein